MVGLFKSIDEFPERSSGGFMAPLSEEAWDCFPVVTSQSCPDMLAFSEVRLVSSLR